MIHTHDLVAFLTAYAQVHAAPGLSPAERSHVIRASAEAFLSRVRPPAFITAVRRLMEQPSEETSARPDSPAQPPNAGHKGGKVPPSPKGRVAR